jgi:hypothetical protein
MSAAGECLFPNSRVRRRRAGLINLDYDRDRSPMEQIKTTDSHRIYKKRSGRHAVQDTKSKRWVNGDDKAAVLLAEGLIEPPKQKAPEPAPEAEAGTDADATEAEGSAAE